MQKPGGLQLLIAEDSTLVRERLVGIAREHLPATSICSVATGMDAVAVFDQSNPDAVLLDLGLPDISGLEVLEHIRRSGAPTEVIVFTNWASPEMAARCHLLGADHFISKAHDVGPFIQVLKTITAGSRKRPRVRAEADSSAPPAQNPHVEHRPARSHPVNLLLVEDDNSQAAPLLKLLRPKLPQGSSVTHAASKAEALQWLQDGRFEVALLDLGLPDSEGVDAVIALRAASPDLAIIVLSSRDDDGTVDAAVEAGADDYFIKGELAATAVARAVISAAKRKRAARALTIALASRQRIMDSSADVICTLDVAGRFVEMGAACERVWGYTREELIGRLSTEWIAGGDQSNSDGFFDGVRAGAATSEFENSFLRKDSTRADMRWTAVWSATDRLIYCVARDITQRKQDEETLRATISSALDCIITVDESNSVLEFNPAAEQTFGWTRNEALGRQLAELIIPPEFRAGHARSMANLFEPGQSALLGKRIEIKAMRSDGAEFPVELSLIRIGTERPARFTAFLRDISGRLAAREKLEAQEAQYRVLFESNPNPMWVYDVKDLRILAVNDVAVAQYGYSREEFLGLTLLAIRPAADGDRLKDAVQYEGAAGTWQHLRKDGSLMLVDVYTSPTTFEGRQASMAVLLNVTEQKRAEHAVWESEREQRELARLLEIERARLLAAQAVAKIGNWEIDLRTGAPIWSEEAYRILEIAPEQAPSRQRFLDAVHPDDLAAIEGTFAASFSQHSPCANEHRLLMADGRIKFVENRWVVTPDADGKPSRAAGTIQDITERKCAEDELAELNKQLVETSRQAGMAEVATSVLHNVGNVLNSVNVSCSVISDTVRKSRISTVTKAAELLREHSDDLPAFLTTDPAGKKLPELLGKLAQRLGEEQATVLSEAQALTQNVAHIKDIVAVQQSYAGNVGGLRETLGLDVLLEDALRMNSASLLRHRIQVVREFGEAPGVSLEKHKVLPILVNLIRNAKHALTDSHRDNKQLVLRITADDRQVCATVADNGIGIAAENMTRIFVHGFTTKKGGHGFGLHSGALAAQEMGGSLSVASDGHGRGAAFTLGLPISRIPHANGKEARQP